MFVQQSPLTNFNIITPLNELCEFYHNSNYFIRGKLYIVSQQMHFIDTCYNLDLGHNIFYRSKSHYW